MHGISPIKISPVAKYLAETKATAVRDENVHGLVRFFNQSGSYIGYLMHEPAPEKSTIRIKLYKGNSEHPFLKQLITIKKTLRYFIPELKFMPVKIDINKSLTDYESKAIKSDSIGHGLTQDRYIEMIHEDRKSELKKANPNIPNNVDLYKINKHPFKYEFKYHLYNPEKRTDSIAIDEHAELVK